MKPTRCPHPYSIRFRDALGKQREESGHGTQGAAPHGGEDQVGLRTVEAPSAEDGTRFDHHHGSVSGRAVVAGREEGGAEPCPGRASDGPAVDEEE